MINEYKISGYSPQFAVAIPLLGYTGMRSEFRGLRWEDIDLEWCYQS